MQKFCTNYGSELKEGAHICLSCGHFVGSEKEVDQKVDVSKEQKMFDLFTFIASLSMVIGLFVANSSTLLYHTYISEINAWTIIFSLATMGLAIPMLIFGIKVYKIKQDLKPVYLSIIYLTIPFIYLVTAFINATS